MLPYALGALVLVLVGPPLVTGFVKGLKGSDLLQDTESSTGRRASSFDEASTREEATAVVRRAAEAVSAGDRAAFLDGLEVNLKAQVEGDLDLSAPRSAELARVLRNAGAIAVYPNMVLFEVTIDSEKYVFFVSKEGGEWKLGGF